MFFIQCFNFFHKNVFLMFFILFTSVLENIHFWVLYGGCGHAHKPTFFPFQQKLVFILYTEVKTT